MCANNFGAKGISMGSLYDRVTFISTAAMTTKKALSLTGVSWYANIMPHHHTVICQMSHGSEVVYLHDDDADWSAIGIRTSSAIRVQNASNSHITSLI